MFYVRTMGPRDRARPDASYRDRPQISIRFAARDDDAGGAGSRESGTEAGNRNAPQPSDKFQFGSRSSAVRGTLVIASDTRIAFPGDTAISRSLSPCHLLDCDAVWRPAMGAAPWGGAEGPKCAASF